MGKRARERRQRAIVRRSGPSRKIVALGLIGLAAAAALALLVQARSRGERPVAAGPAASGQAAALERPTTYGYRITNVFPHDPQAFTQGLIFRDGFLFESTGLNGRSSLRKVRLADGVVVQQHRVDDEYFAEGLTDWSNHLLQLTWQSNVGFVYDLDTLALRQTFRYAGEGWGLARDDRRLVMSDGSARLRFLDPETFAETGELLVHDGGLPVRNLNELEVVNGEIFANVWQSDDVLTIDPASGRVTGRVDLSGLLTPTERAATDVLNGIAHDAGADRLFVTGKLWPKLFEIRLERRR